MLLCGSGGLTMVNLLWLLESWIVLAWVSEWAILTLWQIQAYSATCSDLLWSPENSPNPAGKHGAMVHTFGCNQVTWNAQDILLPQEIGIVPDQWAANEIPKS